MIRRIYVASSWRNQYQPNIVRDLRRWGHQAYDFRNLAYGMADTIVTGPEGLKLVMAKGAA